MDENGTTGIEADDAQVDDTPHDTQAIVSELHEIARMCSEYHRHKETISWTALGVVFAFCVAMGSYVADGSFDVGILVVLAVSSAVILVAFAVFIFAQMKWKDIEQAAMNTALRFAREIASGVPGSENLDMNTEGRSPFPNCVSNALKDNSKPIDPRSKIYAGVVILSLALMLIAIFAMKFLEMNS